MTVNRNRLYIGNSQNMSRIGSNEVDFIFTGPPYWNHLRYSVEEKQLGNIDDYKLFHSETSKVWAECYRVLKPGSVLCIQANDLYVHDGVAIRERIPLAQDFSRHIVQNGFISINTIFWNSYLSVKSRRMPKEDRKGASSYHVIPQRMQYLLFFIKKGNKKNQRHSYDRTLTDYYWDPFWDIKTKRKFLGSHVIYNLVAFIISRLPLEEIMENAVLKRIKDKTINDFRKDVSYPAASDYRVIKKILTDFTKEGDLVLDPFAGSGTTLKVACDMHRGCIGYEINKEAAEIIGNRFDGEIDIL